MGRMPSRFMGAHRFYHRACIAISVNSPVYFVITVRTRRALTCSELKIPTLDASFSFLPPKRRAESPPHKKPEIEGGKSSPLRNQKLRRKNEVKIRNVLKFYILSGISGPRMRVK